MTLGLTARDSTKTSTAINYRMVQLVLSITFFEPQPASCREESRVLLEAREDEALFHNVSARYHLYVSSCPSFYQVRYPASLTRAATGAKVCRSRGSF